MRVRLAIVVFLFVAVTLVVFATFGYYAAHRIIRQEVHQRLHVAANDRAQMISRYVAQQHERVKLVASRTRLRKLLEQRDEDFVEHSAQILRDAREATADFVEISIASPVGIVVTSTDEMRIGVDVSASEDFGRGATGAHLGELFQDGNDIRAILTAPAKTNDGILLGVVMVDLDTRSLVDMLLAPTGLNDSSEIRIGRREGQDRVHYLLAKDQDQPIAEDPLMEWAIAQGETSRFVPPDSEFHDDEVLAVYQAIPFQRGFQHWGMVVQVPAEEAYRPIRALQQHLLPLSLAVLVASLIAGWLIASRYARPVMKLTESATAIASGDHAARVPVTSHDEIGVLSQAFNEMARKVQASHQTLEKRVAQRTEELARANAELQRSNHDLQQFAYTASHDLQEPLRAVTGYTELLQRMYGSQLDDQAHELMQHSVDGARRMKSLIDNLMEYARVQTQGRSFRSVNVEQSLQMALRNLERSIIDSGAEVTAENLGEAVADSHQLTQVFQNLISNALKFRRDAPPRIQVNATDRGSEVVISVKDNGIGIAEKDVAKNLHHLPTTALSGRISRHGPGPGDLQANHRSTRRTNLGGVSPGPRQYVLVYTESRRDRSDDPLSGPTMSRPTIRRADQDRGAFVPSRMG